MKRAVLLDTGVLSLVTHPGTQPEATACRSWMENLTTTDREVVIPEICDYELRRELLRADKAGSVRRLDALATEIGYLPIDTPTMRVAAKLWSDLRRKGRPTASDERLDADVILGAQALEMERNGSRVVVATSNVRHLKRMCDARAWNDIV